MDDVKTPTVDDAKFKALDIDVTLSEFFASLRRLAIAALVKTEITAEEKFALCWASGVPVEFKDGKFQTTVKCDVVRLDDRWQIFQGPPTEEKVTKPLVAYMGELDWTWRDQERKT